jgi:hypothetical protein
MRLVLAAIRTKLFELEALGRGPLVLGLAVVPILALATLELNDFTRHELVLLTFSSKTCA